MERETSDAETRHGPITLMLGVIGIIRRIIGGSVSAILVIAIVAITGASQTINMLLAESSPLSLLFLLMLAIVLADLIAKFLSILSSTFPDLIPKLDEEKLKRAALIRQLRPGQTVALLSSAYLARLILFVAIFALLGLSYAGAPQAVQQNLFGTFGAAEAIEAFLREGIAGSLGYFLFFLGPDNLLPITRTIVPQPLTTTSIDGDLILVGVRLYGLAFVLALLQTLVAPITYIRARLRARKLPPVEPNTSDEVRIASSQSDGAPARLNSRHVLRS